MSTSAGIDLCFDPNGLGNPDAEGHYPLGFGLIELNPTTGEWEKVAGYSANVETDDYFIIKLYDLSQTVGTVDYVSVSWRPDGSSSDPANASPFDDRDFETMDKGLSNLSATPGGASCGCGSGGNDASGNEFAFANPNDSNGWKIENTGSYEVTVELRITVGSEQIEFKCDPKIIVGS